MANNTAAAVWLSMRLAPWRHARPVAVALAAAAELAAAAATAAAAVAGEAAAAAEAAMAVAAAVAAEAAAGAAAEAATAAEAVAAAATDRQTVQKRCPKRAFKSPRALWALFHARKAPCLLQPTCLAVLVF